MQDRLPQSRSDAVLQARTGHITVLRELLPYIWPANRPDLRLRVVFALGALVVAKVITLAVPIAYKAIVDALTGNVGAQPPRRSSTCRLATRALARSPGFPPSGLPPSRPC